MTRGFALCVYAIFSCVFLRAGFLDGAMIGGEGTDLWNSLWNVDFFWGSIISLDVPSQTMRLNAPHGGSIWIPDFLGALTMGPFVYGFGWDWGYQLWLIGSCTLLGWCTHCFALDIGAQSGAWIAGFGVLFSGVFISGVHNGASEGIGVFWLVLAMWRIWRMHRGMSRWYIGQTFAFLGGISSWYSAVTIGVFWLNLCLGTRRRRDWMFFLLWGGMLIPFALISFFLTTGEGNLIGIKNMELMEQVRRTIGASSVFSYVVPSSFLSVSDMWRFGGSYIHSSYMGLILFFVLLWRIRDIEFDWRVGTALTCFVLSLGPVLLHEGSPVMFGAERGIPLPYFLLEFLWGFNSLTLLYRFSFGVVLMVALVVGHVLGRHCRPRTIAMVFFMMCVEMLLWSPVREYPHTVTIPSSQGFALLADKDGGSVLNHPVVAGRMYLFEQVLHKKSIYDTINEAINKDGRAIWSQLEASGCGSFDGEEPIFLVTHRKIEHRPQREDRLVQKAIKECSVLYSDNERIIVELK